MDFEATRAQFFPFNPIPSITVRSVDDPTVFAITGKLADQVFVPAADLGLRPYTPPPQHLRAALQQHSERFVFYNEADEPVGWSIGEQTDPDAFFMRWTGILPAYQKRGIYAAFLRHLLAYLQALGYERVTSNHMVNNRAVLIAKMKAGFIATGMSLDERWGALLWLTYYLDDAAAEGFRSAFSLERYTS